MAPGRRHHPVAGAHRMPTRRSAQSALARHRRQRHQAADAKTGPRSALLGKAARALIDAPPGPRNPDAFLFPNHPGSRHAHRLAACWRTVCEDATIGRLRLHDLRHAASQAVISGKNRRFLRPWAGVKSRKPDHVDQYSCRVVSAGPAGVVRSRRFSHWRPSGSLGLAARAFCAGSAITGCFIGDRVWSHERCQRRALGDDPRGRESPEAYPAWHCESGGYLDFANSM